MVPCAIANLLDHVVGRLCQRREQTSPGHRRQVAAGRRDRNVNEHRLPDLDCIEVLGRHRLARQPVQAASRAGSFALAAACTG